MVGVEPWRKAERPGRSLAKGSESSAMEWLPVIGADGLPRPSAAQRKVPRSAAAGGRACLRLACLVAAVLAAVLPASALEPPRTDAERHRRVGELRGPTSATTVAEAAVQGTVFAGGVRWYCSGRNCVESSRSAVPGSGRPHRTTNPSRACAELAAEVGPLRTWWLSGDPMPSMGPVIERCNQDAGATPQGPARDSSRFRFGQSDGQFWLEDAQDAVRHEVPSSWVLSAEEAQQESEASVSSIDFVTQVQEFALRPRLIGLRVSSYAIAREGSAQAAAGRDVFLLFDDRLKIVSDSGVRLGVTQRRDRAQGQWSATTHRFYLGDASGVEVPSLAVLREDVRCGPRGPRFNASELRWYVYRNDRWVEALLHQDAQPTSSRRSELPPLAFQKSPVRFVNEICAAVVERRT